MAKVPFTNALREEYEDLFNACVIRSERAAEVEAGVNRLLANKGSYDAVTAATGVPWHMVAIIHSMEGSLNFKTHLHNGDPLTARTVQVPKGRPRTGQPPFTWEDSAADALGLKGLDDSTDWSLAGTLYQLEGYNGWGYRLYHPDVLSPYLWSFSEHYISGKYIADGTWSATAVSKQVGAAALLRRLAERGEVEFEDQGPPEDDEPLVVTYSNKKSKDAEVVKRAEKLQEWLNTFPGIFVKVDGVPGERTSNAYKGVTGQYLPGDPRDA